jgi:hypothetical protein
VCQRDELLTKIVLINAAPNPSHGMVFIFIWAKRTTSTQVEFHQLSGVLPSGRIAIIHPFHKVISVNGEAPTENCYQKIQPYIHGNIS